MITEQHRKETLSRAYVQAVVGKAGCILHTPGHDYGVDLSISHVEETTGVYLDTGHMVTVQLKATHAYEVRDGRVVYDLDAGNYNKLVRSDLGTPAILVLMCLPGQEGDWLDVTTDAMILRRCAFWISLRGQPPTANARTVRVEIPCEQVFNPEALLAIMQRVVDGGLP